MNHCCYIDQVSKAPCPNEADYEVYNGPGFDANESTHTCAKHLSDMLTTAHEHRIFRLT